MTLTPLAVAIALEAFWCSQPWPGNRGGQGSSHRCERECQEGRWSIAPSNPRNWERSFPTRFRDTSQEDLTHFKCRRVFLARLIRGMQEKGPKISKGRIRYPRVKDLQDRLMAKSDLLQVMRDWLLDSWDWRVLIAKLPPPDPVPLPSTDDIVGVDLVTDEEWFPEPYRPAAPTKPGEQDG